MHAHTHVRTHSQSHARALRMPVGGPGGGPQSVQFSRKKLEELSVDLWRRCRLPLDQVGFGGVHQSSHVCVRARMCVCVRVCVSVRVSVCMYEYACQCTHKWAWWVLLFLKQ